MSVDVSATVLEPVGMGSVVIAARATMCLLLGMDAVPAIEVFADPRFEEGRRVDPGRRLRDIDLADEVIGGRMSAGHFDVRLAGTDDLVWLHVFEFEGAVETVSSPTRTCVGVVLATALSLAVAEQGRGEFVDDEIRMLDQGVSSPEAFVERTRLAEGGGDLETRCELFMRQFTRLKGWPRDVSVGLA